MSRTFGTRHKHSCRNPIPHVVGWSADQGRAAREVIESQIEAGSRVLGDVTLVSSVYLFYEQLCFICQMHIV